MKKLFTLLCAVMACVGSVLGNGTKVNGVYYIFNNTSMTATVTYPGSTIYNPSNYYDYYSSSVYIPSKVTYAKKEYTVTAIGSYAFADGDKVKSVTLPSTIVSIGSNAFKNCKLTSITIPENVASISYDAFLYSSITSVVWNVKKGRIGGSNSIYKGPFSDIRINITSFVIGDEVEYLPDYLCYGMRNLTSITIPNSVKEVGSEVLYGCTGLTQPAYNDHVFLYLPASYEGEYVIKEGIEIIGSSAFSGCNGITSISIPNSVTRIGDQAFINCTKLSNIELPSSVNTIGNNLFSGCVNLPIVNGYRMAGSSFIVRAIDNTQLTYTIPENIKWIGDSAFFNCSNMETIEFPQGLRGILPQAFRNCSKLGNINIPTSLIYIGQWAFMNCNAKSVQWNAKNSSFMKLPYDGKYIFNGNQITSFILGSEVENIPDNLMSKTDIESIIIPKSVKHIGNDVCYGCEKLTSITWNATNCQYDYMPGLDLSYYGAFYTVSESIQSFTFGDDVKTIPSLLCNGMTNVAPITIPCSVDSIGYYAFSNNAKMRNCGKTKRISTEIVLCTSDDAENVPHWVFDTLAARGPMPDSWKGYGGKYIQYGVTNTYDSIVTTYTVVIGHVDSVQLEDTIICRRGAEVCDNYGNCQVYNESGVFRQVYKNIYGCDSVVKRNVILRQDTFLLPDTTICYGENVSLSDQKTYSYAYKDDFESSKWDGYWNKADALVYFSQYPYETYHELYWPSFNADLFIADHPDDIDAQHYEVAYNAFYEWYNAHFHRVNDVSECPAGIECSVNTPYGETFYSDGIITRSFISSTGCDSIVSRKVFVNKSTAPKLFGSPEQDYLNTGSIQLFDVFCSSETYVGYDKGSCGPYDYTYTKARYTHFKLDGKIYNRSNKTNEKPSYNDMWSYSNYCGGDKALMKADYTINNVATGLHTLVFFTDCDSVVQYVEVPGFGIKINGIYYTFDKDAKTAQVVFRGESHDMYENEYTGDLFIPDSVELNGVYYSVQSIHQDAFYHCDKITSITLESAKPLNVRNDYGVIYKMNISSSIPVYVPYGSLTAYKGNKGFKGLNLHVLNPKHANAQAAATSAKIALGDEKDALHIISCGIEGSDNTFTGNIVDYTGLEPNSEYKNITFFVNTREGDYDTLHCSFSTLELTLNTMESKAVASTTAILLAETNISEAETNCGFEWKRNDAPEDMPGTKVFSPVANGTMAGRLKNLKDDVYYKYRAFYQSAKGTMYYGGWKYIFTGDIAVEFDPILYTYSAVAVTENAAVIKGYALAGSEDFTEQGFEYWSVSRVSVASAPARMPAALGEKHTVTATGINMKVTLTDLDAGTMYKYRAYAKVGDQVLYGAEMSFTTQGTYVPPTYSITFLNWDNTTLLVLPVEENKMPVYNGETPVRPDDEEYTYTFTGWTPEIVAATEDATYKAVYTANNKPTGIDQTSQEPMVNTQKLLKDGQLLILRGDKTYTVTGQER